jgi:hypothetical protein
VGAAAGTPSQTLSPTQHPIQQPNLALSQTAPRLTPSSTLLPTRKRGVVLVSRVLHAFSPRRSANTTSATRHPLLSGFPRVNSDRNRPIDLPLKRSNGAVTTSACIDSNTRYHCGPTKLIDDRVMAFERSFSRRPSHRRSTKILFVWLISTFTRSASI